MTRSPLPIVVIIALALVSCSTACSRTDESTPDRGSLWAGLFDLRENLLGRAAEDLRALAA